MKSKFFLSTIGKKFHNPQAVRVEITFDSAPSVFHVSKADLLYDKKSAFCIRLADGYRAAYFNSTAIMFGNNLPDELGNTHPGCRYTDGCGNEVPFSCNHSIIAYNPGMDDFRDDNRQPSPSMLWTRWSELAKAVDYGHSIDYHGYVIDNGDTATYEEWMADLTAFRDMCLAKFGFRTITATNPNGWSGVGSTDGKCPWWDAGYLVSSVLGDRLIAGVMETAYIPNGVPINPLPSGYLVSPKLFPSLYHYENAVTSGGTVSFNDLKAYITACVTATPPTMMGMITHNILQTPNSGTMSFVKFKELMEWLEDTYGRYGDDSLWVTSVGDVIEYLFCREFADVETHVQGNKVILVINLPENEFRKPALTLKINSNLAVKGVAVYNVDKYSHNLINSDEGIINLEFSPEFYNVADRYITIAESAQTQNAVDLAQWFTNRVADPVKKNLLQARINDIEVGEAITYLVDFGRSHYPSGVPYNDIIAPATDISTWLPSDITLKDISNVDYGVRLAFTSAFTVMAYDGMNTGNNSGLYLDSALRDSFAVSSGVNAILEISGLPVGGTVDFKFLGSRTYSSGTQRITRFTVYDNAVEGSSTFSQYVDNTNSNNIGTVSVISGAPVNEDGKLYIKVSHVSGTYAHFSVLEFTVNP